MPSTITTDKKSEEPSSSSSVHSMNTRRQSSSSNINSRSSCSTGSRTSRSNIMNRFLLLVALLFVLASNVKTFRATYGTIDKSYDEVVLIMNVPTGFITSQKTVSAAMNKTIATATTQQPPVAKLGEEGIAKLFWSSNNKNYIVVDLNATRRVGQLGQQNAIRQEQQKQRHGNNTISSSTSKDFIFSACLLIKDDNDILNEWIAYHFSTLHLRHLIVAVDPSSHSTPKELLEKWRQPPFQLQVDEWTDHDFMPKFFNEGKYHLVPNLLVPLMDQLKQQKGKQGATQSINSLPDTQNNSSRSDLEAFPNTDSNTTSSNVTINNHRFRQLTFLDACIKSLRRQKRTWMVHIDSDEYVVINPLLRSYYKHHGMTGQTNLTSNISIPIQLTPDALANVLQEVSMKDPQSINYPCISMPRLLFGSIEEDDDDGGELGDSITKSNHTNVNVFFSSSSATTNSITGNANALFNRTKFETLRWKFHGPLVTQSDESLSSTASKRKRRKQQQPIEGEAASSSMHSLSYSPTLTTVGGPPKVMMDISAIPPRQLLPKRKRGQPQPKGGPPIHSIHRPSINMCRKQSDVNFDPAHENLFSINHYLGSWSRYNARSDARRSRMVYDMKANVKDGKDDDWMDSWINHFIQEHGIEQAATVLGDYVVNQ